MIEHDFEFGLRKNLKLLCSSILQMLCKNNNGSSFLCLNSDKVVRTCVHLIFMSFLMTKEYTIATRVCLQQCPKFYRGLHYTQKNTTRIRFPSF